MEKEQDEIMYYKAPSGKMLKFKKSQQSEMLELIKSYENGTITNLRMKAFLDQVYYPKSSIEKQ